MVDSDPKSPQHAAAGVTEFHQIDSVAWFAVTGASAAEAQQKAMSARAETVFNGAPMGDDPPLICPRHLTAELAVS